MNIREQEELPARSDVVHRGETLLVLLSVEVAALRLRIFAVDAFALIVLFSVVFHN